MGSLAMQGLKRKNTNMERYYIQKGGKRSQPGSDQLVVSQASSVNRTSTIQLMDFVDDDNLLMRI